MPIRAVVFDLFDTLVDLYTERVEFREIAGRKLPTSVFAVHGELTRALDEARVGGISGASEAPELVHFAETLLGVDKFFRETRYAKGFEVPSTDRFWMVLERLGIEVPGLTERLVAAHMGELRKMVGFLDHHAGVLVHLGASARIGLCSNFSNSSAALEVLADAGLTESFDSIVISDANGYRKPRPEIFEEVLGALEVAPEETLHVGDKLEADIRGASEVGIRTVWLTRRVSDPKAQLERYDGPNPDYSIEDLHDLPVLVARMI